MRKLEGQGRPSWEMHGGGGAGGTGGVCVCEREVREERYKCTKGVEVIFAKDGQPGRMTFSMYLSLRDILLILPISLLSLSFPFHSTHCAS